MNTSSIRPRILAALAEASRAHPFDRKLLICGSRLQGSELLRTLSAGGTPWIGWEIATPYRLALELVQDSLAASGESIADEFSIMRLIDDAIDAVVSRGNQDLRDAITSASFRAAVHRAVLLLRSTDVTVTAQERTRGGAIDRILAATLLVREEYTTLLQQSKLLDHADVLGRAVAQLRTDANAFGTTRFFVLPATRHGLRGELLDALLTSAHAELLPTDPVHGLDLPALLLRTEAEGEGEDGSGRIDSPLLSYLHAPDRRPSSSSSPRRCSSSRPPHPSMSCARCCAESSRGASNGTRSRSLRPIRGRTATRSTRWRDGWGFRSR